MTRQKYLPRTEAQFQSKVIKWLNEREIFAVKIIAANKRGVPDLFFIHKARVIFCELKSARGKLSELQKYQAQKIVSSGAHFFIIREISQIQEIITNIDNIAQIMAQNLASEGILESANS